MADLAYSATIQEQIALMLTGGAYSTLTASHKNLIDGTWTTGSLASGVAYQVFTSMKQIGQWYGLTGAAAIPAEWEPWFIARTVLLASQHIRPDRTQFYKEQDGDAEIAAIDAYATVETDYDPGATPEASTLTLNNIRKYVIQHCARKQRWETVGGTPRQRPRLWVPPTLIDHHLERVLRNLWGRADWRFKKRKTRVRIEHYSVTGASYVHTTKTLTKTSGFGTLPAGSRLRVSSGTGATLKEYVITSATTNQVVLETSIGSAADGQTDIAAQAFSVTFTDLAANETYHSTATRKLYFENDAYRRCTLEWIEDDELQLKRSCGYDPSRPLYFQTEVKDGVVRWHLVPFPDQDYDLYGSVYVKGPTITTESDTNTAIARFPADFYHIIKDLTLAEVQTHFGDPDGERLRRRLEEEDIEVLLPIYVDEGRASDDQMIRDANQDVGDMTGDNNFMGGAGY